LKRKKKREKNKGFPRHKERACPESLAPREDDGSEISGGGEEPWTKGERPMQLTPKGEIKGSLKGGKEGPVTSDAPCDRGGKKPARMKRKNNQPPKKKKKRKAINLEG